MGEETKAPAFLLDTRPVLNFLAVDRLDLISTALRAPVYVSPSVLGEVHRVVNGFWKELKSRSRQDPWSVDPQEISLGQDWRRWNIRLLPPLIRRLKEADLSLAELHLASQLRARRRDLDAGEREILAAAKIRGWGVIIDEMPGHCWAEEAGIPNDGTLGVLIRALQLGCLQTEEAENLWSRVRLSGPRRRRGGWRSTWKAVRFGAPARKSESSPSSYPAR